MSEEDISNSPNPEPPEQTEAVNGQDVVEEATSVVLHFLSRDDIVAADDLEMEAVPCPEWAPKGLPEAQRKAFGVMVRGLTGTERDSFEDSIMEGRGRNREMNYINIRAKLIARSICDPEGRRLFSDKDIEILGRKSSAPLSRIFNVAQRLSGLTDNDVEELAGNSKSGQSENSGTSSPSPSDIEASSTPSET